MKTVVYVVGITVVALLSGCATSFDIDGHSQKSRVLKAEERMLLVTDKATRFDKDVMKTFRAVCAEPSPDAMTAIAFSGAAKATVKGQEGEINAAYSKAIAELGKRTPVVQLLRDNLYRSCEAYMNGLLTKEDYYDILVFFDVYSLALLSIESLTGSSSVGTRERLETSVANVPTAANSQQNPSNSPVPATPKAMSQPSVSKIDAIGASPENADKILDIIKEYNKTKAILFVLMELKKINNPYSRDERNQVPKDRQDEYSKFLRESLVSFLGTMNKEVAAKIEAEKAVIQRRK